MNYREKINRQSNYWYNDGLKRANIRDLSGAIISLRRSLQYSRHNIGARNLLGLMYYGRGEVNEALVEWIISKNLKPRDNIANYFIRKVQEAHLELERMNSNIKKYNQCLKYCKQDAEDLALIQLKKIVNDFPTFLKAYQLMALLLIQKEQYSKARQMLKRAYKLDTTHIITLHYMSILDEKKLKKSPQDAKGAIAYSVGNETIIQPVSSSLKDNAGTMTIVNILIGVFIGVAVVAFLFMPNIIENRALKNASAIREYSEQLSSQRAQINALKTELDTYRVNSEEAESTAATGAATKDSYEAILKARDQVNSNSYSNAAMAETLLAANRDALGEEGQKRYDTLAEEIFTVLCERAYTSANQYMGESKYSEAIEELESIMQMQPAYNDFEAMYLLAQAYEQNNDAENAQKYYKRIVEEGPDTEAATKATTELE